MFFLQNSMRIRSIPVVQIEPKRSQPRRCFSKEELEFLTESIRENGIVQPISVRKVFASKFELISGERRLRAAIFAGFKTVPCVVFECDENQAAIFDLLENLQRSEFNFFEEAEAIQRLVVNWGITQEVIAQKLGKKQSTIANKLRLLKLSEYQRSQIIASNLSERHARALLKIDNVEQRDLVLNEIISKNLNVLDSEALVDAFLNKGSFIEEDLQKFIDDFDIIFEKMKNLKIKSERAQVKTEQYIEYTFKIYKTISQ